MNERHFSYRIEPGAAFRHPWKRLENGFASDLGEMPAQLESGWVPDRSVEELHLVFEVQRIPSRRSRCSIVKDAPDFVGVRLRNVSWQFGEKVWALKKTLVAPCGGDNTQGAKLASERDHVGHVRNIGLLERM
jgi:hypothetical protein